MLLSPDGRSAQGAKPRRGGRVASACVQCRRLKRKCDRQWPCNHCLSRRLGHQCQFDDPKKGASAAPKMPLASNGEQCFESNDHDTDGDIEIRAALKTLGYADSSLFTSIIPGNSSSSSANPKVFPIEIQEALRAVPPRPYADILISGYFTHVNYHYEAIHQPTFIADYAAWWSRRTSRAMSDVAFASLVLQMCALGTQFTQPSTAQKLESELGESVEDLGIRMHGAAQRLSTFIPPGEGGLPLVQQLFLAGGWLKNRVEITKSWHLLCSAVRETQEVGLHTDSAAVQDISTCQREVRRRMWYILNIWDISFSGSFGRQRIIHELGQVPPPDPRFELAEGVSEETSAAAIIILEYRLWAFLSDPTSETRSPHAKIQFVEDWIRGLPAMYSATRRGAIGQGDLFAIQFRRTKLHCMGYMALLAYLRPYLLIPPHPKHINAESRSMCQVAVQVAIHLMHISKEFFTLSHPIHSRYFFVQFCPFDTASTLCSALLRDATRTWIPQRLEVIKALGCALWISEKLRNLTKMGVATCKILTTMLGQLELSADEQEMMDRARQSGDVSGSDEALLTGEETAEIDPLESFSALDSIEQLLARDDFDIETCFSGAQDEASSDLGLVGVGYNGSGIMALEEQVNSDAMDGNWSWVDYIPRVT